MLNLEPGSVVAGLRVERELGRGAFGVVYLAEDELIGRHVALKVVYSPSARSNAQDRALREARAVGRLKSPNIVTLHRVHPLEDGDGWMLEMEYIPGGSLNALLDQERRLATDQAIGILRGVLAALHVAHEAGVVHGDVKPGNVLLEASGDVKLADFGLSWMLDDQSLSGSVSEVPFGTPMYMAPEVIMGERGNVASDLWSAGVVFYRMLSGQMPFRTKNLHDLFFSVQNSAPQPLPVNVPAPLQTLVLRLLEKAPEDRPASVAAVIEELDRITGDVEAPAFSREPVPAALPAAPLLFGRDEELRRFAGLLDELADGRGAAVLLAGEAGSGKTALVQTLAAESFRRGMLAIEATVTTLEGAQRPLLRAADRAAPVSTESEVPPRLVHDLLEGKGEVTVNTRQQVAWAVEQLFLTLAEKQPVVLTIENAHMADAEDLKLFRELARRLSQGRVLMVMTYRTYDVEASASESHGLAGIHELASLEGVHHLTLGPLESEAIYKLLEARSGAARIDADVAQRVINLSEGNPLFAVELMRHLEEEGAIVLDGSSIKASKIWDEPSLPGRFHELVACRLAGLTDEQRELLDAAAVDGREFDGEALEAVLDRSLLDVLRELQRLYRERNLVEPHGNGYRFTSSVVQEVIYEEAAPALRRAVHRKLADHLEQRGDDVNPERLGLHWERAGQRDRARPHLMRAAVGAARRLEHRRLVDLCERAGMVPEKMDADEALRYLDTLLRLAPAYNSIGRHAAWGQLAETLLAAARDAGEQQAEYRIRACQVFMRTTHVGTEEGDAAMLEKTVEVLEPCLERGQAMYQLGLLAKFRGELSDAEQWLRKADSEYLSLGREAQHGEVLHQLGTLAWRHENFVEASDLFEQAARISGSLGRQINASASEVNLAMVRFDMGELEGTEEVLERAIHTLALEGSAMAPSASVMLSEVLYAQGDLAHATRTVDAALDMVADSDYLPALEAVRRQNGHLAAVRGMLPEARESLAHARSIAETREHKQGRVTVACLAAQLNCFLGDLEAARDAALEAVTLASASKERFTREEPLHWLPEAGLYGLPPEALPEPGQDAFAAALKAFAEPATTINVPTVLPPRRRVVMDIIRGLLASEASRRGDHAGDAIRHAEEALAKAQDLGHVFLEARLLRHLHGLTGEEQWIEQHDALIWRVADGLDTSGDRSRLLHAWAAPSGSS